LQPSLINDWHKASKKDHILVMDYFWPALLLCAAFFEVAGDAASRKGLEGSGFRYRAIGFVMLGIYGIVVNLLK
jgi:hypothetical protein